MTKTENSGFLKTWKDDRGFGFIKPDDGSEDIFIHISSLQNSPRRPYRGDTIHYQIEHSDDGRSKAINASIEGVDNIPKTETGSNKWLWITAIFMGLIGTAAAIFFTR